MTGTLRTRRSGGSGFAAVIGAAAVCAAAVLAPGAARADLPYRLERPTALRFGPMLYVDFSSLGFVVGEVGPRFDAALGVTVAHQVFDRLALEGTVGGGGQGKHSGLHLGAAARATAVAGHLGALTLALGTHAALLKDFGPVFFAHAEAAFELRTRTGFDLVAGGGLAAPLNDSRARDVACPSSPSQTCQDQFRAGAVGPWAHVEAGWSF